MTASPEGFRIYVADRVLDDLHVRLQRTRWSRLESPGWTLGTDRAYLRDLIVYWHTGYPWREREALINELMPQRRARAHGVDVHFVHIAPRRPRALPLLLLHGWPDSFLRYRKVVRDLALDFEVIVPSLPGFGFTGPVELAVKQPNRHSAEILYRLMTDVLGFDRFGVAGGDGGSVLAQIMAIDHPESVTGVHLTDLGWHVGGTDVHDVTYAERRWLDATKSQFMADGAYAMVQATRPRSLAPALADSPVALASWILDRFHSWSDSGDLDKSFSRDDLLDNIMIYWVSNTIGSSMSSYYADRRSPSLTPHDYVNRPVGLALFPKEPGGIPPRRLAERTLDVVRWTEMPHGSHFAALEEPDRYAADVREFFRGLRSRTDARKEARHDRPSV